jgi:hypothetical protein
MYFLHHLRNSTKFTLEMEVSGRLTFLDVVVEKKEGYVRTAVYRKPAHTGRMIQYM